MFKSLEKLKALRIPKTLITLGIISEFGLVIYVASLPISLTQKIITIVLCGIVTLFAMLADDHLSKDTYLDELRKVSEKLEKGE